MVSRESFRIVHQQCPLLTILCGVAGGTQSSTTLPMGHDLRAPARMSRCVHPVPLTTLTTSHLAPLDTCPHARSQAGGALQSSCPCCRKSFFPHQKGLVLCGAILLYNAAPRLPRVAKIDLRRVLRGGRSASHAPCRPPGTRWAGHVALLCCVSRVGSRRADRSR